MKTDLKERMCALVDTVFGDGDEPSGEEFEGFFDMAKGLFDAKRKMEGTKSQTRDLLGEILFSRLRRNFQFFLGTEESGDEVRVAEWVLGSVMGGSSLREFAAAIDHVILQSSTPTDFSFAGRADFISLEEVMQLLGAGKHTGCLSLERGDNRIDVYVCNGQVSFLDPHHMVRRVIAMPDQMNFREIPVDDLSRAYQHAFNLQSGCGTPLFLALEEKGWFKDLDLRQTMRQLGTEVLYEFLRDQGNCSFFYRQLAELPEFVIDHDLRLGITPILLEGSKCLDDWLLVAKVFPDQNEAVVAVEDIYAKIGDMNLSVLEIKLLAQINSENSPRDFVEILGLPVLDIYQMLVRFAQVGAVIPSGGMEALNGVVMSVEESMEIAFEALDANDDATAVSTAFDKVFSDDLFGGGDGENGAADQGGGKFSLDMDLFDASSDPDPQNS